ncbi:MAG: NifB/NifX family molybdenum-iron cluster-binding protein [Candidatus Heimdallarchaeota archaeon]
MVIVAVPSNGNGGMNEQMNARFGRCPSFTFVTIKDNNIQEVRTVPNHASEAMGGAGVQAVQIIGNNGAKEVIVGFLGPNAAQALNSLNLKIYQAPDRPITVKEVIQLYSEKKLQLITSANVSSHHGMGQGGGMGGGRGMGRQNRGQF